MNAFTPEDLDRAFVPVGTPTLGDLIHRIESDQCLEAIRKRDLASGLRCLSRVLGLPVSGIPADAFRTALEINELTKDPAKTVWNTVNAWEHAQRNLLSWPQRRLTKPARHNHYAFGLSAFPTGFQDDLTLYLDNLASPDPLESDRPLRTLRPATVASLQVEPAAVRPPRWYTPVSRSRN